MSTNKFKYWTVTTTKVVKANNKKDAIAAVRKMKASGAKVLSSDTSVDRISASEARDFLSVSEEVS